MARNTVCTQSRALQYNSSSGSLVAIFHVSLFIQVHCSPSLFSLLCAHSFPRALSRKDEQKTLDTIHGPRVSPSPLRVLVGDERAVGFLVDPCHAIFVRIKATLIEHTVWLCWPWAS